MARLTQAVANRSTLSSLSFLVAPSTLETGAVDARAILEQGDGRRYSGGQSHVATPAFVFRQCEYRAKYAYDLEGGVYKWQRMVTRYRRIEYLLPETIIVRLEPVDEFHEGGQNCCKFE